MSAENPRTPSARLLHRSRSEQSRELFRMSGKCVRAVYKSAKISTRLPERAHPLRDGRELRAACFQARLPRQQHHSNLAQSGLQVAQLRFVKIQLPGKFRLQPQEFCRLRQHRRHLFNRPANPANIFDAEIAFAAKRPPRLRQVSRKRSVDSKKRLPHGSVHQAFQPPVSAPVEFSAEGEMFCAC